MGKPFCLSLKTHNADFGFPCSLLRKLVYADSPQDPRNPPPRSSNPLSPWAVDLFNIGRRHRLRLQLQFRDRYFDSRLGNGREDQNQISVYNAIHTLSIIRRFLLINAEAMENQYAGIRVHLWLYQWRPDGTRAVALMVECDDELLERSDSIVSRLQDRDFGAHGPDFTYFPNAPPYREPMPPPPPPTPPERDPWDDDEDERNPSILGR